jgi:pilus assembly protein Flp/PilA
MLGTMRRLTASKDDGASAVEYGLLVAAIAALIVIIVFALGGLIKEAFNHTCDTIASKTAHGVSQTSCDEG